MVIGFQTHSFDLSSLGNHQYVSIPALSYAEYPSTPWLRVLERIVHDSIELRRVHPHRFLLMLHGLGPWLSIQLSVDLLARPTFQGHGIRSDVSSPTGW